MNPFARQFAPPGLEADMNYNQSLIITLLAAGPMLALARLLDNFKGAQVKTITRPIYVLAALIVTVALAIPAAAQTQVPFQGTFQGDDAVNAPTITQSITGIGTLVGKFSSVTVLTTGASGGTGTGRWIAANGDSIDTTVVGSGEHVLMSACQIVGAQPEDTYAKIVQTHTITGGTGRFAGVHGSFTVTLYHDVVERSDGTHGTCGSYSGTITPPGAAH